DSTSPTDVRAGAVHGLGMVALSDRPLFESFVTRAQCPEESPLVRGSCLYVVGTTPSEDPSVSACLTSCLDDSAVPPVQRLAAQLTAEALTDGRLPWASALAAKAQATLTP